MTGRLDSKTDNVIDLAHLEKQVSVDYVFMTKILLIAKARHHLWCQETLWLKKTLKNI